MKGDMGKVLLTGATGFIGLEVARQLCAQGLKPRLLVRRPIRAPLLAQLDAEVVQGDLERPRSLARAVQGIDTVLHLGARAIFEEYELVRPTIVEGTRALAAAAQEAGVSRFVYASSLLVYDGQTEPIDQRTEARPRLGYGKAKLEAEQVLSAMATQGGFSLAVIRLPHVYGARDLMFNQIRQGRVVFPGNGKNHFAHLHVEDAARVLLAVAAEEWTGISPVADDQAANWNDFFAVVREYYPRFRFFGVPMWLALLGTHLLTPIRRLGRYPSLYTPDAVLGWNSSVPVAKGVLWDEIGISPNYSSIYEGIPAVLDDCVPFRWIHPVADRAG
jgi:nucleoside-diphosphate-sugar epimerase